MEMKPKRQYVMDFIPDKDLYAAVMFACKMVKDGKAYNDAVRIASYHYDVDMDDVRHYMSQRSSRSRAERTDQPKRKYYWFAVEYWFTAKGDYDQFRPEYAKYAVEKGFSEDTVKRRMEKDEESWRVRHFERVQRFDTEDEAKGAAREWASKRKEQAAQRESQINLRKELMGKLSEFKDGREGKALWDTWTVKREGDGGCYVVKHDSLKFPFEPYFNYEETAQAAIEEVVMPFMAAHPEFEW